MSKSEAGNLIQKFDIPKICEIRARVQTFFGCSKLALRKKSVVWAFSSLKHCTSVCLNKTREELKNANCEKFCENLQMLAKCYKTGKAGEKYNTTFFWENEAFWKNE